MSHPRRSFGLDRARTQVEYAIVKATVANFTDAAVLLKSDKLTLPVWVPRRAMEAGSRVLMHRAIRGAEVEIRVELRLALARGLV